MFLPDPMYFHRLQWNEEQIYKYVFKCFSPDLSRKKLPTKWVCFDFSDAVFLVHGFEQSSDWFRQMEIVVILVA